MFNYKQFLKDKGRQDRLEKITMIKKIMKQEGSSFYNLINFSKWVNEKEKPLQIYSESEKIVKKRLKSIKLDMYRKISLLYYIGALNKILFIKLRLKQIKLAKEIFILDVEEGIPVFLPSELKCSNMPLSFKYYDGTLNFLDSEISNLTKAKYQFMLESKNIFYQEDDYMN